MNWIKNLVIKFVGKKVIEDGVAKIGLSKAKLAAVVYILILGVEQLSAAWGHPIIVPVQIKELLAGVGLWTLRDAIR